MKMKVSDYIVKRMAKEGVKTIFGYQGGNISHLIDSIGNSEDIEFVETYHEQAAAFAANAYAQLNETIGVALASSGPGAINLMNGVANAFCDSIPCIFFTGDVNTTAKKDNGSLRQNAFQEVNILPMVGPITKYCVSINRPEDVVLELDKSISIALSDRKGPVLVNLPHDIQRSLIDVDFIGSAKIQSGVLIKENIQEVVAAINKSKRPVIIVGGGMKTAKSKFLLKEFLRNVPMPVVSSLLGMDVLNHDHRCYRGVIGSYGNRAANLSVYFSDCIIVLGSRLDDRQIPPTDIACFKNKVIIHVELDEHEIENKLGTQIKMICSAEGFLEELLNREIVGSNFKEWMSITEKYREKFKSYQENNSSVHPNDFIYKLSLETDGVFTLDVGNNLMYSMQSLAIGEKANVLASGGLGSMGYSLPAAIGACYASKSGKVYCITGDGGLQMNLQELQTVDYHNLPINIILLNNSALGMIYDLQTKMFPGRYTGTISGYSTPNFRKVAEAYNFRYFVVNNSSKYDEAIELLKNNTHIFVEIQFNVDTEMMPVPGKGIFEQLPIVSIEELEREVISYED